MPKKGSYSSFTLSHLTNLAKLGYVAWKAVNYARSLTGPARTNYIKRKVTSARSARSSRRRTNRRSSKKASKQDCCVEIKRQIKDIKRTVDADMGTHIHKVAIANACTATVNENSMCQHGVIDNTKLEAAVANLRYYNPATPGTLTTADASTGTYHRDVFFKSVYSRFDVRNNYQVPVEVSLYAVTPRLDTNITPTTAYTNGLADQGAVSSSSVQMYPTDSMQFNDVWRIIKSKKRMLQPGSSFSLSQVMKNIKYDPSLNDSHASTYQINFKAFVWLIRVQGVTAHDTVQDEQGFSAAGVDYSLSNIYTISYAAGVDLLDYSINETQLDTFTNAAVLSNKPVSDNQSYSVA